MECVLIDERRIHVDFSQSVRNEWKSYNRERFKDAGKHIVE